MAEPTGRFPRKANLPDPYSACPNKTFHASTRNIRNLSAQDYWAAICPELSAGGKSGLHTKKRRKKKITINEDFKHQMHNEGVFQVHPSEMRWSVNIHRLALSMVTLMQQGWPPTFLIMFNEVWTLIEQARVLMAATTGNACNMDVLCWYVDPNHATAGFSPHRDRQPDDSPATFRAGDSSPMYSTCWVPLTDACPENSCLYMVPRWADPGYYDGDDDGGPDPLSVALSSKESFQSIRAFPAPAGSAIIFSHRIIHWGSRGRKGFHTPRLAISWGCADDAYEPPYFSRSYLPYPPLEMRAALACGQMLVYHERFSMTARQLTLYYKFFSMHADKFHESYREKVASEFLAATKEVVRGEAAPATRVDVASNGVTHGVKIQAKMQSKKIGNVQEKKRKKCHADGEPDRAGTDTCADVKVGGSNAAAPGGDKAFKKAKKAAITGNEKTQAAAHPSIGGGNVTATRTVVSPAAKTAKKDKKEAAKRGQVAAQVAAVGKEGALQGKPAAAGSRKAAGATVVTGEWSQDDGEDDSEDEEENPGWEGLLGGDGGGAGGDDSHDEAMEDPLDALLDAVLDVTLARQGDWGVDDFDDYEDDDM
ncbi:hypothetical protein VaNZ11_008898 [Volvox africanus]|uniref:Uncharacterized protein n=1 Tax=Volvox africanus TaxID=51714 RepID=A0ABQ5S6R0_9CHLO|nr:hypothetical protein VaNZ11_008898 [Volvox africanus]